MPGATPHRSIEPTLEDFAHLMRIRLLVRRTQANTKAEAVAVEAVRREVPVAVRRPTRPGGVEPTAATEHAGRARCSTTRVRHATTRLTSIPILASLIHIAVHVMQTPCVRVFALYGMGRFPRVLFEPSVLAQVRFIISKAVLRHHPSTTGILPLSFGGR